jgi:hypothetical protein
MQPPTGKSCLSHRDLGWSRAEGRLDLKIRSPPQVFCPGLRLRGQSWGIWYLSAVGATCLGVTCLGACSRSFRAGDRSRSSGLVGPRHMQHTSGRKFVRLAVEGQGSRFRNRLRMRHPKVVTHRRQSGSWAETISFPHKKSGAAQSPRRLKLMCAKSAIGTESPQETQPMTPAHDCSVLHVFAGTWQSPANL